MEAPSSPINKEPEMKKDAAAAIAPAPPCPPSSAVNYWEASPEKEKEIKPAAADAIEGEKKDTSAAAIYSPVAPAAPVAPRCSPSPAKKQREAYPAEKAAANTIDKKEDESREEQQQQQQQQQPQRPTPMPTTASATLPPSPPAPGHYWSVPSAGAKRERKAVETLVVRDPRDTQPVTIKQGKGSKKLVEMETFSREIGKIRNKDPFLKVLHGLCFGRGQAKATEVKGRLREFSGLVYEDGEEERREGDLAREKVEEKARRMTVAELWRPGECWG